MTQKERLVELIKDEIDCDRAGIVPEWLANHLLANGVVVPPCKVGRTVYVLRSKTSNGENLYLREEQIDHYRIFGERSYMCFFSGRLSVPNYLWEATVFLTREEAEKALAERSKE
jgi:hypothetical protein